MNTYKPAIFLEIKELSQVSMICLPCDKVNLSALTDVVPIIPEITLVTLTASFVKRQWINLHKNMQGAQIAFPQLKEITSCNICQLLQSWLYSTLLILSSESKSI